ARGLTVVVRAFEPRVSVEDSVRRHERVVEDEIGEWARPQAIPRQYAPDPALEQVAEDERRLEHEFRSTRSRVVGVHEAEMDLSLVAHARALHTVVSRIDDDHPMAVVCERQRCAHTLDACTKNKYLGSCGLACQLLGLGEVEESSSRQIRPTQCPNLS